MTTVIELLKAERLGVREFKNHVSADNLKTLTVITDHGRPISVNLPYDEVLELMDILDDLKNKKLAKAVSTRQKTITRGQSKILKKDRMALIKANKAMPAQERLIAFYNHSKLMGELAFAGQKRQHKPQI